ncbi:hypothetical protein BJX66DRAFT_303868 [Aspergillus keveii]|uniref:Uncharacterized protein n=1 Tax=Aspergillus keveii TaxID=714993 RepID=A0ABR4G5V8_9EURO
MFPIEYGPEEAELVGESSVPSPDYGQNHPEQRVTSNDDSVLSSDAISDAELQAWSVFALSSTSQFGGSGAKLITSNNLEACSESVCDDSTEYASMGGKTLPDTPTTFTELSSPTNDTDVFSSLGLISDGAADEDKSEMCTQLDQLELSQANIPQVKLSTGKETPGARKRRKAEADAQKQRRIAYQGEWRKLHRLQCRAACARWRRRNPDKVKASRENITAEQKPRYNTWSREYMREKAAELTYDEREERRENHAQKRDKPGVREKAAERSRAWREKNKGAQDSEFHTANAKLNKQIGRAKKNALAAVGKSNSFGPISLWIVKLAERYRRTREAGKIPWELPDRFLEFARLHQSSNAAERANARTLYASIEESVIKFLQKKHPKAKCST